MSKTMNRDEANSKKHIRMHAPAYTVVARMMPPVVVLNVSVYERTMARLSTCFRHASRG